MPVKNQINIFFKYIGNIRSFKSHDWVIYISWVGLMLGLLGSVLYFIIQGQSHGVIFPDYIWCIPFGICTFTMAIAIDTIGHLTLYREALRQGEDLVHKITIFAGVTSTLGLCCAYNWPGLFKIPSLVMVTLSILYSLVDEALHWNRDLRSQSDSVEMISHFFILFGHLTMISAWTWWFLTGYQGVADTLKVLF